MVCRGVEGSHAFSVVGVGLRPVRRSDRQRRAVGAIVPGPTLVLGWRPLIVVAGTTASKPADGQNRLRHSPVCARRTSTALDLRYRSLGLITT